ncbi:MAG: carbohydrate kinase [Melioribacteraceae bacterium]|nr:MAG: carbohydrate kinase [Melioribacteraceae bacterium]
MKIISIERLNEIKNGFAGKNVAVIGDLMIDCYFWGAVKRISPEAPVPVVEVDDEFVRFGGAANVAYNIVTLGGKAFPVGVIGNDSDGESFKRLMEEAGISSEGIIVDNSRPTTAKTRVIASQQHVVRIDKESKENISADIENKIYSFIKSKADTLDAVILEDYNKGVLTRDLIERVISLCEEKEIVVTVDPKLLNFFEYKNVTVFKPNRKETEDALGTILKTPEELSQAGKELLERLNAKYVLLTLGEEGLALFESGQPEKKIPTKARKVSDVSGAGDTVISTLTMALAAGAEISEAAYLANYAGGLVCEEVGIVPIKIDHLFSTVGKELKNG